MFSISIIYTFSISHTVRPLSYINYTEATLLYMYKQHSRPPVLLIVFDFNREAHNHIILASQSQLTKFLKNTVMAESLMIEGAAN